MNGLNKMDIELQKIIDELPQEILEKLIEWQKKEITHG